MENELTAVIQPALLQKLEVETSCSAMRARVILCVSDCCASATWRVNHESGRRAEAPRQEDAGERMGSRHRNAIVCSWRTRKNGENESNPGSSSSAASFHLALLRATQTKESKIKPHVHCQAVFPLVTFPPVCGSMSPATRMVNR